MKNEISIEVRVEFYLGRNWIAFLAQKPLPVEFGKICVPTDDSDELFMALKGRIFLQKYALHLTSSLLTDILCMYKNTLFISNPLFILTWYKLYSIQKDALKPDLNWVDLVHCCVISAKKLFFFSKKGIKTLFIFRLLLFGFFFGIFCYRQPL